MNKIIVEKPKSKFGIYAWINTSDKMVYVGETCDLNRRFCEHIRSMYDMENSSNTNLVNAVKIPRKSVVGMVVYYADNYDKNFEYLEKEWLIDETIYMYAFVQRGYRLYNGEYVITYDENGYIDYYPPILKDNEGTTRSFLMGDRDDMANNLYNYCQNKYTQKYDKETFDRKIKEAFNNIEKLFERIDDVNKIKKNVKQFNIQGNNYYVIKTEYGNENINDINKVCNNLAKVFLQKDDVALLDLVPKTKEDLIKIIKKGISRASTAF